MYAAGYLLLVALAGAVGAYALYIWHQSSRETVRLNSMMQEAQAMRGSLYLQLKEVFDAVFLADQDARKQYAEYDQRVQVQLSRLDNTARGAKERAAINALRRSYQELRNEGAAILNAKSDMPFADKQRKLNTELEMHGISNHEAAIAGIEELLKLQQSELDARLVKLDALTPGLLLFPVLLALGLLVFSRVFLQRAIVAPLADMGRATALLSAGQLDERVPVRGPRELQSLAKQVNEMAQDLDHSRASLLRAEKQAALGSLVPVLAHNIRNPLAAIRATAQMMSDPALTDESKQDLQGIIHSADRLERWTRSLLSYLHPMKPSFSVIAADTLMEDVLSLSRRRIEEKFLMIDRVGWGQGVTLAVDVELMEQALHGLLSNAIDASPDRGAVVIEISASATEVKFLIDDDGLGLPFTPSPGELSPGPTTKRYGTGLGIPFAYKVCEEHSGHLEFLSREPRGTRVSVSVPRQRKELDGA